MYNTYSQYVLILIISFIILYFSCYLRPCRLFTSYDYLCLDCSALWHLWLYNLRHSKKLKVYKNYGKCYKTSDRAALHYYTMWSIKECSFCILFHYSVRDQTMAVVWNFTKCVILCFRVQHANKPYYMKRVFFPIVYELLSEILTEQQQWQAAKVKTKEQKSVELAIVPLFLLRFFGLSLAKNKVCSLNRNCLEKNRHRTFSQTHYST